MRANGVSIAFGLMSVLTGGMALAQNGSATAPANISLAETTPSIFSRVIPHPTGNNGYEEFVRAADLIQNNADAISDALPGANLALKRQVLADPRVTQALLLVRAGLDKPIRSPRTHLDLDTPFPELSPFRQLARLLIAQQHVDFADGRVNAAIEDLHVGLAFGYHIQTDTLISGLVGVAVHAMIVNEFAHHIDQLSTNQCDQVRRIVTEGLSAESPAARLLTLEQSYGLKTLEARRSNPDAMLALLDTLTNGDKSGNEGDSDELEALRNLQAQLIDRPQDLNAIINDAEARIRALHNQAMLILRLPITQRKPIVMDNGVSPGAALARAITPNFQPIMDKYALDLERLRLLGVHVLIHRYRLEHKALPNSLAELHSADLTQDSFTGNPLVYQRDGDHYTLTSQGPLKLNDLGQSVSRERVPVKLSLLPH